MTCHVDNDHVAPCGACSSPKYSEGPKAIPSAGRWRAIAYSWALAVILGLPAACTALMYPIEEHSIDAGQFHVYRAVVYSAARAEGQLYPRWVGPINAGLGGPLFLFYSPLTYAMMDVVHRLGFSYPLAWRLVCALALLGATTGMYGLSLAFFERADVALACAAVFGCSPYLVQEVFVRGSPQGFAVAFYPWLLWAVYRLGQRSSATRLVLVAACWAAIILLHNLGALLCLPVLLVLLAFIGLGRGAKALLRCVLGLCLGLLLAAFYIVPFVIERPYVQLQNVSRPTWAQPAANPLALKDLLAVDPPLDAGFVNTRVSLAVGVIDSLALASTPILTVLLWRKKDVRCLVLVAGMGAVGLITIWMQTSSATPIWAALPALAVLQFRWRLLSTIGLVSAVCLGAGLSLCSKSLRQALVAVAVAGAVGLQWPYLYPDLLPRYNRFSSSPGIQEVERWAEESGAYGLTSHDEFLPRWRTWPLSPEEAHRALASTVANLPHYAHLVMQRRTSTEVRVSLDTTVPFRMALYQLYFPGWQGYVDGCPVTLAPALCTGYATLFVPAGFHTVTLRYEGTPAQRVGDAVSIITAGLLAAWWAYSVARSSRRAATLGAAARPGAARPMLS